MTDLTPLLSAWHARDWYALAVLIVVVAMRGVTRLPQWEYVSRRWQWLPPVLLGSVAGLAGAYHDGAPWQVAVAQAVAAGLQIGLGAIGVHHAWKRTKPEPPRPSWQVLPALALLPWVPGCVAEPRTADEEGARQVCLARAELAADKRAAAQCPKVWVTCEHRPTIEADLKRDQEACR